MSYRRSDAGGYAGWLRRELSSRLPGGEVFRDVDSLHGGERWPERLEAALARCEVVLAVIGPDWLSAANEKGRRLDDPNDRVRLELEAGIRRGIPIVPALVGGALMPSSDDLPESLAPLHEWQAVRLSDETWEGDLDRLVKDLASAREAIPGELQLGAKFAGHRIEELIGRGGMGIVYRAHHLGLNRLDAIKVIAPQLSRDVKFRERFVSEAHLAASIRHPNVLAVYDAGEENGLLYLTMEFVNGGDLRTLLAHEGPLAPALAVEILAPISDALQVAHENGLIHRDVKPGNILLEERDGHRRVYLGDFGLAREKTSATGLTSSGQWFGTADYVSPEQVMGEPVTPRSDVYALGCVLFEMLSGSVPYPGHSETAKLVAHATREPPSLLESRPDLSPSLDRLVQIAMSREPSRRFASAAEFGEALSHAVASQDETEDGAVEGVAKPPASSEQAQPEVSNCADEEVEPQRTPRPDQPAGKSVPVQEISGRAYQQHDNKGAQEQRRSHSRPSSQAGPLRETLPPQPAGETVTPRLRGHARSRRFKVLLTVSALGLAGAVALVLALTNTGGGVGATLASCLDRISNQYQVLPSAGAINNANPLGVIHGYQVDTPSGNAYFVYYFATVNKARSFVADPTTPHGAPYALLGDAAVGKNNGSGEFESVARCAH